MYYYRIYDDKEEMNFFKSALTREEIEQLLKDYERTHEVYQNPDFVTFLKEQDREAELIEVTGISY